MEKVPTVKRLEDYAREVRGSRAELMQRALARQELQLLSWSQALAKIGTADGGALSGEFFLGLSEFMKTTAEMTREAGDVIKGLDGRFDRAPFTD